jgi:hypothetical protein
MDRFRHVIILFLCSFTAQSAVFKCDVDGVVTYSQDPCGDAYQEVDYHESKNVISRQTRSQNKIGENSVSDAENKKSEITDYIRKGQLSRDVRNLENKRKKVFSNRNAKIKKLRDSRRRANNNLAGATWEQSLAEEMSAVSRMAETEVYSIDRQIEHLRIEMSKM